MRPFSFLLGCVLIAFPVCSHAAAPPVDEFQVRIRVSEYHWAHGRMPEPPQILLEAPGIVSIDGSWHELTTSFDDGNGTLNFQAGTNLGKTPPGAPGKWIPIQVGLRVEGAPGAVVLDHVIVASDGSFHVSQTLAADLKQPDGSIRTFEVQIDPWSDERVPDAAALAAARDVKLRRELMVREVMGGRPDSTSSQRNLPIRLELAEYFERPWQTPTDPASLFGARLLMPVDQAWREYWKPFDDGKSSVLLAMGSGTRRGVPAPPPVPGVGAWVPHLMKIDTAGGATRSLSRAVVSPEGRLYMAAMLRQFVPLPEGGNRALRLKVTPAAE